VCPHNAEATKKALWGWPRLFDLANLTNRGNLALPKLPYVHGELETRQNTKLKAEHETKGKIGLKMCVETQNTKCTKYMKYVGISPSPLWRKGSWLSNLK